LGQGNIDLEKVIYTLKKPSFNGTITIEPKNIEEGIKSKNVIEKLWRSL
jgi:sugar phosphate isomerase/epimerase